MIMNGAYLTIANVDWGIQVDEMKLSTPVAEI